MCYQTITSYLVQISSIHKILITRLLVFIQAFIISFLAITSSFANPVGGQVVAGSATIQQVPQTTVVNQTSNKAIINWQSFNIAPNETTRFQQPSAQSVMLNRINPAQGASQIFGRLSANGQIILVNQAGLFFGSGAHVDVGGIIASTSDISNANFMAGKYIFDQPSTLGGSIVNRGKIIAAQNGLVALIGNNVSNEGEIQANLGRVALASGNKFTVDLAGDQLVNFVTIDEGATKAGKHPHDGSELKDAVSNSGKIIAQGGKVILTARSASRVLDNAINMKGVIVANSVRQHGGQIILSGGSGTVKMTGKIYASGKRAGQKGGSVKIYAKKVILTDDAVINVSGRAGGGAVLLGGDYQGRPSGITNAENTYVGAGVKINADALETGNGGKIIAWGDHTAQVYGSLSVRGGNLSGNGGLIETSGKYLDISSIKIDARAPHGVTGTWLLDPSDLTISNAVTSNTNFASDTYTANQPNVSTVPNLNVTDLTNALGSANILVLTTVNGTGGNGDIFVNAPITWASNNTLTLSAYQNIVLNADITNNNATSSANLVLRSDNTGTGMGTICGAGGVCAIPATGIATLAGTGTVNAYYNPVTFGTQDTLYVGGTAPEAYMLVNTASQLADINNYSLAPGQNYALGRNIDLSSIPNFIPIATFNAKFDGQNYTLDNLTISDTASNSQLGLFSVTDGATISNLHLTNLVINATGDNNNIGGLIGNAQNTAISNVSVGGAIDVSYDSVTPIASLYLGGLIGQLDGNSTLANSISNVDITTHIADSNGFLHIGGALGTNAGILTNTIATGNVSLVQTTDSAGFDVGGLVGSNYGTLNEAGIVGSSSSGLVSVQSDTGRGVNQSIGGLVGFNNSIITNAISTANSEVSGDNNGGYRALGGLVGSNNGGTLTNMSSSGTLQLTGDVVSVVDGMSNISYANDNIGGVLGNNNNNDTITLTNLISSGAITTAGNVTGSSRYVGGLIGYNQGSVINSSSSSSINASGNLAAIYLAGDYPNNANEHVGGLIGSSNNNGSTAYLLQNLSSTGAITVTGDLTGSWLYVGGLMGTNNESSLSDATSSSIVSVTSTLSNVYIPGPLNPNVNAGANVGGLIGSNNNSNVPLLQNLTSTGSVNVQATNNGSGTSIGGLLGNNRGTIRDSHSSAAVTVNNSLNSIYLSGPFIDTAGVNVGGSIGNNDNNGQSSDLQNITSSGALNISGDSVGGYRNIGGLIGNNSNSPILQSSSTSNVQVSGDLSSIYLMGSFSQNANDSIGGLMGNSNHNSFTLSNLSSAGNIIINGNATGSGRSVGGLIGSSQGPIDTATSIGSIQVTGNLFVVDTGAPSNPFQSAYESVGGLIGSSNDGLIQNTSSSSPITIVANTMTGVPNVSSSNMNVGGLIGSNNNTSSIDTSSSSGDITVTVPNAFASGMSIGGLVATNGNTINQSTSSGNITAFLNLDQASITVGGFVAANGGAISDSTTSRSISVYGPGSTPNAPIQAQLVDAQSTVGGFVGFTVGAISAPNISGPISTGSIYTASNISHPNTALALNIIGGLAGQLFTGGNLDNVHSTSSIRTNFTNDGGISLVGGVVGLNQTPVGSDPSLVSYYGTSPIEVTVTNSNSGLVFIGGAAGGVLENVGQAYNTAPVTVTILNNTTNGIIGIGGFAGGVITASATPPELTNAYNMGAVTVNGQNNGGSLYVGGFLGLNGVSTSPLGPLPGGNVSNTYSNGRVSVNVASSAGQFAVGGLVGNIDASGTVNNSFWDTATSTQSVGVGSGVGNNVVGGCLGGGSCAGGGTANLSAQSTYTNVGWNFATTWGIIEGVSYPYLNPGSNPNARVITGFANSGSTVGLTYGGSLMTTLANSSGTFYFFVPDLADSDPFLTYLSGGISNIVSLAPQSGGSVTGLTFAANSLVIGDGHSYTLSNSLLSQAVGNITNDNILYTAAGADLTFGNATTPAFSVLTTATTNYLLDGNILFYPGVTDNFIFNGAVTLGRDATVNVSNLQFNGALDGAYNLVLGTTGGVGFAQAVGELSALQRLEISSGNGISVLQNVTTTGNQNYLGNVLLGNNTAFSGNDIIFANNVTGNGLSQMTVNLAGSNGEIAGHLNNIANFTLNAAGTFYLNSANTYSGTTIVNSGILQAGVANAFSANSAVTLGGAASLDLTNFNNTIGSLAGSGQVLLGAGTLTTGNAASTIFSGNINGSGGLIKQGSGTFTLASANSYSGATQINAGSLEISNANQLGSTNNLSVATSGTLKVNNAFINGFDLNLNGGTLLGTGNAGWGNTINLNENSFLRANGVGDSLTTNGAINGAANLTLLGSGTIALNGGVGNVTPLASLLSNVTNLVVANGGITSAGSQIYNSLVTLNADTTFAINNSGSMQFNNGINGNNNSLNLTGVNTQFSVNDPLTAIMNLTVNGIAGNNTLRVNTNNIQIWNITSLDAGNISNITGVTNGIIFSGIQNLAGGNQNNYYIFDDAAVLGGSINGGNTAYSQILDYSRYTTPIQVSLTGNVSGYVQNYRGDYINRFLNINNINGSDDSRLVLSNYPSTLTFSTASSGSVNGLLNFNQFESFGTLNSSDNVYFVPSAFYNYVTQQLTISGISVPMDGFNPALFGGNISFYPETTPVVSEFNPLIPGIITGAGPKSPLYVMEGDYVDITIIQKIIPMGPITIDGKKIRLTSL